MQTSKGKNKLDAIITEVNKNGIVVENVVKQLEELRELAKIDQDPLVIKVLRLVYTYMDEDGHFDLNLLAEEEVEDIEEQESDSLLDGEEEEIIEEEEEEEEEEANFETVEDFEEQRENFLYFLNLVRDAENEYNRKDLKKIRTYLWEELYG